VINNVEQAAAFLRGSHQISDEVLYLSLPGFCISVRSNSTKFLQQLERYFSYVAVESCRADVTIEAYDTQVISQDLDWTDWAREPGKTGRKDAYIDLDDGRLLLKVRTGMLFLQSMHTVIAAGPCSALDNQVINFINSQYMNWLQQNDWLICHASGLDVDGHGLGMAGLSGGGKSTLMLSLMDYPDVRYVTNDRLFIRRNEEGVAARGIPKLPRINPGTIVHNPALHGLISAERRQELLAMPRQELWHLEEKHDVMIDEVYGSARLSEEMKLDTFLVLNWSHDTDEPTQLKEVRIEDRRDLLPAIMKSPGPFFQFADGAMYQDSMQLEEQAYIDALRGVRILEASGKVDIPLLMKDLYQWIKSDKHAGKVSS